METQIDIIFKNLNELKNSIEIEKIKQNLDKLKDLVSENIDKSVYKLDYLIKSFLQNNYSTDFFDKLVPLFSLINDPRIFLDELDNYCQYKNLLVPTLMFLYELQNKFDFEYDDFYIKLCESIDGINCKSEGYLLFLLRALKRKNADETQFEKIIYQLSFIAINVSSKDAVKVVYSIIVIMRMHPMLFNLTPRLGNIYMLLHSHKYIAQICKRIIMEYENSYMRPQFVFLENFTFPSNDEE